MIEAVRSNADPQESSAAYAGWQKIVSQYSKPSTTKAVWQIVTSFGGLFAGWAAMYISLRMGWPLLALLLALPTAGFLMRVFIIQHDCGHNSFLKSRRANDSIGIVCSLFTLTAYKYWRKSHAVHHAHHAELEERGIGDVWTLTVEEYRSAPRLKRLWYRIFRHPFFLFGFAPTFSFVVMERLPFLVQDSWRQGERASVWWTNAAVAGWMSAAVAFIGLGHFLALFLPVIAVASTAGVWMFYVQHQFERTYWEHTEEWDYTLAAMHGSSYYKLPRILQWFTGNIGFHHIHHLSPRIPNYNLERCHDENQIMQRVTQLTLRSSLGSLWLTLWDEEQQRLVTFREALQMRVTA